jgi:hypothetical protein
MRFTQVVQKAKQLVQPRSPQDNWFDQDDYSEGYEALEPDNARWELWFQDILNNFEHTLRNEVKDPKTGEYRLRDKSKPLLSDRDTEFIMSDLRAICHKGTPLGNNEKPYVFKLVRVKTKAFKKKLLLYSQISMIDKINIEVITYNYLNLIMSACSRSINDGERKIRAKRFPSKEIYSHDEVGADEISPQLRL